MFLYLSPFNFQGPIKMKTVEGLFVISFLYLDVLLWLHNTYVNGRLFSELDKNKIQYDAFLRKKWSSMNLKNDCGTSTKGRLPHRPCWSVVPVVPKLSSLPFDPLFSVLCVDCSLFVCIFDVSSTSFNYVLALTLVFSIQFKGIFHHKFLILFNSLLFRNNCLAFVFIVGFLCLWLYILSLLLLNDF